MAFIIALASAPIQAIALGIENMEQIEENEIDTGYEIDKDVFLVEEDLSKRGQFEKHYLCSDGTYVSVTYPEAIHYLDDNGKRSIIADSPIRFQIWSRKRTRRVLCDDRRGGCRQYYRNYNL